MPIPKEGDYDAGEEADPSGLPGKPPQSSEIAAKLNTEGLDAILSEGEQERLSLARRTARAVFRDPASVTPRRLALLGEVGLAEFVEQIRADADVLMEKERQKCLSGVSAQAEGQTPVQPPAEKPVFRQPALFRRPRPTPKRSFLQKWHQCLTPSHQVQKFLLDTATYSGIAAIICAVLAIGVRVLFSSME